VSPPTLQFVLPLAAPPERVFAALTGARALEQWFCDAADSEPRVGGTLTMRWHRPRSSPEPFVATWLEFEPPRRAAFRGGHAGYPDGDAGLVRFTLEPTGDGGTSLRVDHEAPAGPVLERFVEGWRSAWPRALERLARLVGTADVGPER